MSTWLAIAREPIASDLVRGGRLRPAAVVEALAAGNPGMPAHEIVTVTGVSLSTVCRVLRDQLAVRTPDQRHAGGIVPPC